MIVPLDYYYYCLFVLDGYPHSNAFFSTNKTTCRTEYSSSKTNNHLGPFSFTIQKYNFDIAQGNKSEESLRKKPKQQTEYCCIAKHSFAYFHLASDALLVQIDSFKKFEFI